MPGKEPQRFGYINALRGYAILAVIAVHVAHEVTGLGRLGQVLGSGAMGVRLFYVASALTLLLSAKARQPTVAEFMTRRLFRIAPMFWLGIGGYLALDGFGPRFFAPHGIGASDVALTALFVNGWHPETINAVVPGGWSIAVEMTFYLVFPLLVALIHSRRQAVIAVVVAAAVGFGLNRLVLHFLAGNPLAGDFVALWFFSQLPIFLMGFLLYFQLDTKPCPPRLAWPLVAASLAGCLALAILRPPGPVHLVYGMLFVAFAYGLSAGADALKTRPIQWIGEISFSAYLWHFAVLHFLGFREWVGVAGVAQLYAACLLITAALSFATYHGIERPFVRLGSRIVEARQSAARLRQSSTPASGR